MIDRVEKLRPELRAKAFRECEVLGKVEIEVHEPRATDNPHTRIPKDLVGRICGQCHECVRVEPPVDSASVRREIAVANPIRTAPSLAANVDHLRLINRERQTALPSEDWRKLPATEHQVRWPRPVPA